MRKVAVIGAGKIGSTVVDLLAGSGTFEVLAIDAAPAALDALDPPWRITRKAMAIDQPEALAREIADRFAVVNCAPYHLTTTVARAARDAGVH